MRRNTNLACMSTATTNSFAKNSAVYHVLAPLWREAILSGGLLWIVLVLQPKKLSVMDLHNRPLPTAAMSRTQSPQIKCGVMILARLKWTLCVGFTKCSLVSAPYCYIINCILIDI